MATVNVATAQHLESQSSALPSAAQQQPLVCSIKAAVAVVLAYPLKVAGVMVATHILGAGMATCARSLLRHILDLRLTLRLCTK